MKKFNIVIYTVDRDAHDTFIRLENISEIKKFIQVLMRDDLLWVENSSGENVCIVRDKITCFTIREVEKG